MGLQLEKSSKDPFIILAGLPVQGALSIQEIMDLGTGFLHRPRAVSGEVAAKAFERLNSRQLTDDEGVPVPTPVCACIAAFFKTFEEDPSAARRVEVARQPQASAAKRQKIEAGNANMESVRLRHIVVRHKDCKHPLDPRKNKQATRAASEAEEILRQTLGELLKDGCHKGDSKWAAQSTGRIMKAIRDHSECKSALKGGSQCGDLGWLSKKDLERLGKDTFADPVRGLAVGEWSDVLHSEQGVHLVMRIA
mmetsp:Transcript_1120/g.3457  ORF Transcript_1120/g.3457 Transcript_1120/m.3457 type:complete len:251 (+) Transcript_1120:108-860(+)